MRNAVLLIALGVLLTATTEQHTPEQQWTSDPSAGPWDPEAFPTGRRYRLITDFNFDGIQDVALSGDVHHFGNAGGHFTLYFGNSEGKYRKFDTFFARPFAVALEDLLKGPRLWTYHRLSCCSGQIGYQDMTLENLGEYKTLEIYPMLNDDNKTLSDAVYDAVFSKFRSAHCC